MPLSKPWVRSALAEVEGSDYDPPRRALARATAVTASIVMVVMAVAGCGKSGADAAAAAQARLEALDYGAAEIETRNILKDSPKSASARLLLARSLMGRGDLDQAEKELERATEFGATEMQVKPIRAKLWLEQRQPAQVIAAYADKTHESEALNAEMMVLVATAHLDEGHATQASAAVKVALTAVPEYPPALMLDARIKAAAGLNDEARAQTDRLLTARPKDAAAWLLKGDLAARQPQGDEDALQAYRKAAELRPLMAEAHSGVIFMLRRKEDDAGVKAQIETMKKVLPGNPTTQYFDAVLSLSAKDYKRAREILQQLVRRTGEQPQTAYLLGISELILGSLAQAEIWLSKASRMAPEAVEPKRLLASVFLRQGDAGRALVQINAVLAARPQDQAILTLQGEALAQTGDFKGADAAFARAAKLKPDDPTLQAAVGRSQMQRGDFDAGLQNLRAAAEADTASLATDLALVSAQMGRGNPAAALKAADAMARKQPESPLPLHVRGRILQAKGDTAGAIAAYNAAVAKSPRFLPAVSSLALLDLESSRLEAARTRYEEFLKLEPRSAPALLAMAVITRQAGGSPQKAGEWLDKAVAVNPQDPEVWLQVIDFHRKSGNDAAALAQARAADAAIKDNPAVLRALAEVQIAAGDNQQATSTLNRLVQVQPRAAEPRVLLALAQLAGKNLSAANVSLATALEFAPDWPPALRASLTVAMVGERNVPRARALVLAVQTRRPQDALGWQLEGELEAGQNNWPQAVAAFRKALTKRPGLDIERQLHDALTRQGNAEGAQDLEQRWLKNHSTEFAAVNLAAEVAVIRQDHAAAVERLQLALKLRPNDPFVLNNLANMQLALKDPEALATARKAVKVAPYQAELLDTLAMALSAAKQPEKAIPVQLQAVELAPRSAILRLNLARLYFADGRKDEARQQLRSLLRAEASPEIKQTAEKLLGELGG